MSRFQVDYLCAIEVTGDEASSFLQSQLSADIEALAPGDCTFAAYCTPRGQVIALLLACRLEDRIHLLCARELADAVLQRLRLYVMRAKAIFELLDDVSVIGHDTSRAKPDGPVYEPLELPLAYLIAEPQAIAEPQDSLSSDEWKFRELSAGIFWLQKDSTEQYIPQMLGFDDLGAVSFRKGCYPGQEIVARARYLGKVKRGVRLLKIEEELPLESMAKVRIERDGDWSQARVMDSVSDPAGGTLAIVHCTRAPESPVSAIEVEQRVYRCATI